MSLCLCPLCLSGIETRKIFWRQTTFSREFYKCSFCDLIFVNRENVLSLEDQKTHYDFHQNTKRNDGYVNFLMRLISPIVKRMSVEARGLDFGSGPYPMLADLFKEEGFSKIDIYDPIYKNDQHVLLQQYHFITVCEVIEHLINPMAVLEQIDSMLLPKGLLVISTALRGEHSQFPNWYYNQDITHINYFSLESFYFIRDELNYELVEVAKDLIIFLKK